MTLIGHNPRG
ncbi:BgTH12-05087 [Blumeria graminis f. sp. triticale]|uniref:BgTH12-05087 n=1 Tax=Blumeria graminis f. sp. triticale TaxID=1689686 RepID=A0A9W4D0T1_BLUGR|nr:BgTH12-05087 [Blumeria graminis f. sp. triticale]